MRLMNYLGADVGEFTGGDIPAGHWTRRDDAPDEMDALTFQDMLGETRFNAIMQEATLNPKVLFQMWRAAAANKIHRDASVPIFRWLESHGVIPAGTVEELWS